MAGAAGAWARGFPRDTVGLYGARKPPLDISMARLPHADKLVHHAYAAIKPIMPTCARQTSSTDTPRIRGRPPVGSPDEAHAPQRERPRPVELLTFPASVARRLRLMHRGAPAVPFGGLVEQTELRFSILRRGLFAWRNDTNHFAGRDPVDNVAWTDTVAFRTIARMNSLRPPPPESPACAPPYNTPRRDSPGSWHALHPPSATCRASPCGQT